MIGNRFFSHLNTSNILGDFAITISVTNGESFTFPASGTNDFVIDWGDDSSQTINTSSPSHTYTTAGIYQLAMEGSMSQFAFSNGGNKLNLLSVDKMGDVGLTDIAGFCHGCSNCTTINTLGFDASGITDLFGFVAGCSGLTSDINLSCFNTGNITSLYGAFFDSTQDTLNLTPFSNSVLSNIDQLADLANIRVIIADNLNASGVTGNILSPFGGNNTLEVLQMYNLDISNATTCSQMIWACNNLETIRISGLDASSSSSFYGFIQGCPLLTTFEFDNIVLSTTIDVNFESFMSGCTSLPSFDPVLLDTIKVVNLTNFAKDCTGLVTFETATWNLSNLVDAASMCENCTSLTSYFNPSRFWNNPNYVWAPDAFLNATNVNNYADIPANWK